MIELIKRSQAAHEAYTHRFELIRQTHDTRMQMHKWITEYSQAHAPSDSLTITFGVFAWERFALYIPQKPIAEIDNTTLYVHVGRPKNAQGYFWEEPVYLSTIVKSDTHPITQERFLLYKNTILMHVNHKDHIEPIPPQDQVAALALASQIAHALPQFLPLDRS